ncbi:MAG TPA: 4-hydroxy-3-methylbut-2-enyl diphosphate reductase [Chlamydiales bacterium]|nr:4-hydroxy-3-methylbut-2-enyl diphosphate reductase [Chlamydiales bacterium]
MKLYLLNPRGFCAGVVRAIDIVEKVLKKHDAPIYVKHMIVHNKHVIQDLQKKGVVFVESLAEVPEGSVLIYSAHGVSPKVREEAKQRKLQEIDATCPLVTKLHSLVKRYAAKNYKILFIGKEQHVEVQGILGEAPDNVVVVETIDQIDQLSFSKDQPLVYLTQTTLSIFESKEIIEKIKKRFPWIDTVASSTICYATTNRQKAIEDLSSKLDCMIVIGDCMSSNSKKLKLVAENFNLKAIMVENKDQLNVDELSKYQNIGITAGASTPEYVVHSIIKKILEAYPKVEIKEAGERETMSFSLPSLI